jgi:drug/metabolite transporter (DMT)-like permease
VIRRHESPRLAIGVWLALGAAVLFGASTPLAKGLLRDASPQLVAGLLYCGSGLGLAVVSVVLAGRNVARSPITRRDWPWLLAAVFFGGIVGPVLLMLGLARTPASAASLLLNLEAVFTATIAWTVFHENVDRRIALGMTLIVFGGALLSWEGRVAWGGSAGPLLVAAACACWAIDNNLTQKVSTVDPVRIAMLKGLIAGAINVVLAIALGATLPAVSVVGASLVIGFFGYGLSLVLFVIALRQLGTARTSAYFSTAPFIGATVSFAIWREHLSVLFAVAAACMAIGLYFHFTERHEHWHVHDPLEHTHSHVHDEHHQHRHTAADPPGEPHTHAHVHERLQHSHPHYPDIHHRHEHHDDLNESAKPHDA